MVRRMTQSRGADVLVLAAHAPELVGLRATLGLGLSGAVRGVRVVCATIGVGLPAAGSGAMRHLRDTKPRSMVLLGSCGMYPHVGHAPLDLLVPRSVQLIDPSVVAGKAAFPEPMQTTLEADEALSHGLATCTPDAKRGALATTMSITTDDVLAARLGKKTGTVAENLEAFSVVLACAAAGVPFASVLAVTNTVGSQGRKQWAKYRRKAADHSARLLLDWLHRGARGLPSR
jgi:nucleoside phosphorylase